MAVPIRSISVYSDGSLRVASTQPPSSGIVRVRTVWDDENPDWNFKSRTQDPGFIGPPAPPAVMRFYPEPREKSGDYRVNLSNPDWKPAYVVLNGGGQEGLQRWEYLVDPKRATFNTSGWPMQAYLTMSGNILQGVFDGNWFRFETLKPSDLGKVAGWTIQSHPHLIQRFTCVKWDAENGVTKRIESTGTPRGNVYWYLITKEGAAYIPARHVKPL